MHVNNKADGGRKSTRSLLLAGILLVYIVTVVTAPCGAQQNTSVGEIPEAAAAKVALTGSIALLLVFVFLIGCGLKTEGKFGKGELTRAIAGTLVAGFSIIAILSFVFGILREHIVTAYIELVGIVIGFYFGQRTVESAIETEREAEHKQPKQG